jgi:hypothetical protein
MAYCSMSSSSSTLLTWSADVNDQDTSFNDHSSSTALKHFHCKACLYSRAFAFRTDCFAIIIYSTRLIGQRHMFGQVQYHMYGPADGLWCPQTSRCSDCILPACRLMQARLSGRSARTCFILEQTNPLKPGGLYNTHKVRM